MESNFTWPTHFGSLAFIGVVYSHISPEPNQSQPWWRPQAEIRRSNKVAHRPTSVAGVSSRFQPPRTFGSGWNNYLLGFCSRNEVQVMQENLQLSSCGILKYPARNFHVLDLITGSPILTYQHQFPLLIQWGLDVKDKVLIKGEKYLAELHGSECFCNQGSSGRVSFVHFSSLLSFLQIMKLIVLHGALQNFDQEPREY